MGDWLQILMAFSFADFSFGLVPHLPYHHRTSQPMVTHIIVVCVSLETESGKCKGLETRGWRPCTFYQVVSFSQKTQVGWDLSAYSYWLLPNNKEQLCISNCERASRFHPFPAHKWLRRQSLKFKNSTKLYSGNLSRWLASTLTARLLIQGSCLGLTSKECLL